MSVFVEEKMMLHDVGTPALIFIVPRISVEVAVIVAVPHAPTVGAVPFVMMSPRFVTWKRVVVALAVEEAITKRLVVADPATACTESCANGVDDPIPTEPGAHRMTSFAPTIALMFPALPAANPVVTSPLFAMRFGAVTESPVALLNRGPFPFAAPKNVEKLNAATPLAAKLILFAELW